MPPSRLATAQDHAKLVKLYVDKGHPWLGLVALVLARMPWRTVLFYLANLALIMIGLYLT